MMRALVPNISRPLPNKLRPFFLFLSRPFLKATATTQRGGNVYFQPSSACKTEKKITMSHGKESRQYDFRCGPNGPSIFIYSCVYHENRFEAEKKKENGRGGGGSIFQQGNGRKPFRILLPHPHRGVVWQLQTNNKVCVASFVSINN